MSAAQTGMPPVSASVEPSLAKSAKKVKTRSSEEEGKIVVAFPAEGSAYSDPFVCKQGDRLYAAACRQEEAQ